MADASSSASIPPGTTITLQNWQQYKQFMPAALLAGYGQQYGWKIGSDPRYAIVVGPTIQEQPFKQLRENTEKYAGQTRLKKIATGGYTIEGYVAGYLSQSPPESSNLTRSSTMFGPTTSRPTPILTTSVARSIAFTICFRRGWMFSNGG